MWHRRGRRMFLRFLMSFGFIVLFVVGGMGVLAWLLTRIVGGGGSTTIYVWLAGVVTLLFLPSFAIFMAIRTFRRLLLPLTELMRAADQVAGGDFSVRMGNQHVGDFGALSKSFNHMVTELELADLRRRNMTADVAHELRTPLHIIQGNLEGILDGVYDPTQEHINLTLDETRLLGRLIEDLRILSLAEAGELPLDRQRVDLAELLGDVETSFSGLAAEQQIELHISTPEGLFVSADYLRLTQVVSNLLANALRHTAAQGRISLSANLEETTGGVLIVVEDNGEGISADDLPFIFDRFWRGDKSRPHSGSTGLGLAISHQLIRAHGGELTVESEVGHGSRFQIALDSVTV